MKNYIDIILINLAFLIVGVCLFLFKGEKVEILGAVIATGISLSLGIRHYKTENDKIFKELFSEFNTKYDEKFNDKLEAIIEEFEFDSEYKLSSDQHNLLVDYLNFCSEEYLWKTKGRIPDNVWKAWENGMLYYFKNPLIQKVFFQEKAQKSSYYGLFEKIENRLK